MLRREWLILQATHVESGEPLYSLTIIVHRSLPPVLPKCRFKGALYDLLYGVVFLYIGGRVLFQWVTKSSWFKKIQTHEVHCKARSSLPEGRGGVAISL